MPPNEKESANQTVEIKHFIETRGGTISGAIKALGYPTTQNFFKKITRELTAVGFNSALYKHVGKRAGHWIVLPAEDGQRKDSHRCLCTKCNTTHLVRKDNFAAHSTLQCADCSSKDRKNNRRVAVRNIRTGEIFPSINKAHASVSKVINKQWFYRKIRANETIELPDGTVFEFVFPQQQQDPEADPQEYQDYFYGTVSENYVPPSQLAAPLEAMGDAVLHTPTDVKGPQS